VLTDPGSKAGFMQLELFPRDKLAVAVEPWGGRSPRELTRGAKLFSLSSEGTGRPNLEDSAAQFKLLLEGGSYGS